MPETRMPRLRSLTALAALVGALGCAASGTDPDTCPPGVACTGATPTIVALRLPAGDILARSVTFYAKRGEDRAGAISFRNSDGEIEKLIELDVKASSLLSAPNGRRYVVGDSVAITITLVGSGQLLFDFQPSGLRFNPQEPAELEIEYGDATGGDVNGDGVVNATDTALLRQLAIWLQERVNDPFFRIETSFNNEVLEEIEADVLGFTRFAIAY